MRLTVWALFLPGAKGIWDGRHFTQDPDLSNIIKMVEDALFMPGRLKPRKGRRIRYGPDEQDAVWALEDDNQVVQIAAGKLYHQRAGTIVKLELFESKPCPKTKKSVWSNRYGHLSKDPR